MGSKLFFVDPDIANAETLPGSFYRDDQLFERMKDDIFVKSWQWIGDSATLLPLDSFVHPIELLENYLSEPLVLVREGDKMRCLSNVCTHRGNLVVHDPGKVKSLSCMYHGRRFGLDGTFQHMPEFKNTMNFPRDCDHLRRFKLHAWGPFLFTGLEPEVDFSVIESFLNKWVGFLPIHEFKYDPSKSRDYLVNCHWALYCDNYLEGFHIPFVHPELNAVLDYNTYETVIFEYGTLQIGFAGGAEETYNIPADHPLSGKQVAAFYFWIFPNTMLSFYPWGVSINQVKPISSSKTKVTFRNYIYDEKRYGSTAGPLMDKVEREDEFVVEGVSKGLRSRFYKTGRFSPNREQGVHHFHRMLAERCQ